MNIHSAGISPVTFRHQAQFQRKTLQTRMLWQHAVAHSANDNDRPPPGHRRSWAAPQRVLSLLVLVLLLATGCGGTAFSAALLGAGDGSAAADAQPLESGPLEAAPPEGAADAGAQDSASLDAGDVVDSSAGDAALDAAPDVVDEPCFTTPNDWCTAGGIGGNPVPCAAGAWSCAAGLCTTGLCLPGDSCEPSQGGAAGLVERCAH